MDSRDPMGKALYLYGCYEYAATELILALVRPETVFLDIGANIGYFSLIAAPRCKKVYAFEPVIKIYRRLERNVARNNLPNVTTWNSGVTDHDGEDTLYLPRNENTGLASLQPIPGAEEIKIPVVTLDKLVSDQSIGGVHLIKIDIEGAEVKAFEGARTLLSQADAPDIVFESHPSSQAANWLRSQGYRVFGFARERDYEARNLVASKRSLPPPVIRKLKPLI